MKDPSQSNIPESLPVISISKLANQSDWTGTLKSEDPLDKEYRLKGEAREAQHRQWRGSTCLDLLL